VERRLQVYEEQTAPVLDYYEKHGALRYVDGDQSPDRVFALLMAAVR
jgi:adenylate kinase